MDHRQPRAVERVDFGDAHRIILAEQDLDRHDQQLTSIEKRLTEQLEMLETKLGRILNVLVGVLIALTTGSIALALNLAAGR